MAAFNSFVRTKHNAFIHEKQDPMESGSKCRLHSDKSNAGLQLLLKSLEFSCFQFFSQRHCN